MDTYKKSLDIRLQPLLFNPLATYGINFLEWLNDAKIVLATEGLSSNMFVEVAEGLPKVMKWQILLVLRKHLDPSLMLQYIQIDDPIDL